MGWRNREVEKKYVIQNMDLSKAIKAVKDLIPEYEAIIENASKDYYWKSVDPKTADFVRLRIMPDETAELTVKHADKEDNTNRVEIDVKIKKESIPQLKKYLDQVHGEMQGSVNKTYFVLFLDDKDTTVSLYKVRGDDRIFIEIEARKVETVDKLEKLLKQNLAFEREPRSLYQIFIKE